MPRLYGYGGGYHGYVGYPGRIYPGRIYPGPVIIGWSIEWLDIISWMDAPIFGAWEQWQEAISGENFSLEYRNELLRSALRVNGIRSRREQDAAVERIIGMKSDLGADEYGHVDTTTQHTTTTTTTTTTTLTQQQRTEAASLYLQNLNATGSTMSPHEAQKMRDRIMNGQDDRYAEIILQQGQLNIVQQSVPQQSRIQQSSDTQVQYGQEQAAIQQSDSTVLQNKLQQAQLYPNEQQQNQLREVAHHQPQPDDQSSFLQTSQHTLQQASQKASRREARRQQQEENEYSQTTTTTTTTTTTSNSTANQMNNQQPPSVHQQPQQASNAQQLAYPQPAQIANSPHTPSPPTQLIQSKQSLEGQALSAPGHQPSSKPAQTQRSNSDYFSQKPHRSSSQGQPPSQPNVSSKSVQKQRSTSDYVSPKPHRSSSHSKTPSQPNVTPGASSTSLQAVKEKRKAKVEEWRAKK